MSLSFDSFATSYDRELKDSLGPFCNKNISLFAEYKIKKVASSLSYIPANILEFGCGTGRNSFFMQKWFPGSTIYGCDISEKSLEIAQSINPAVHYDKITSTTDLSRYKQPFDCIFVSNVFHHIPFNEHQIWLDALYGILSKNGTIFIFEHNPYNPVTKYIFKNSEIDKGAAMLYPSYCYKLLKCANFAKIKRKYSLFFTWRNTVLEYRTIILVVSIRSTILYAGRKK